MEVQVVVRVHVGVKGGPYLTLKVTIDPVVVPIVGDNVKCGNFNFKVSRRTVTDSEIKLYGEFPSQYGYGTLESVIQKYRDEGWEVIAEQ